MNNFDCYTASDLFYLLSIPDDAAPADSGPDKDLIIGKNRKLEGKFRNGSINHYRDLLIFGELSITPVPNVDEKNRPKFVFRNLFIAGGSLEGSGLHFEGKKGWMLSFKEFQAKIHDAVIDRFRMQREDADKIGLRSILV